LTANGVAGSFTVTATVGNALSVQFNLTNVPAAASTSTTLTVSPVAAVFSQPVTFTALVSELAPASGVPTGQVNFSVDGGAAIMCTLNAAGRASLTLNNLAVGNHSVTAAYVGDISDAGSTSAPVTETVSAAMTSTTLTSSANPALFGQPVVFTAVVGAAAPATGVPTGTVAFSVDNGTPTVVTLDGNGVATVTLNNLAGGIHTVTAAYQADSSSYENSFATPLTENIVLTAPSAVVLLTTPQVLIAGQPSQPITMQLQDASGQPAAAGSGGVTINLTSTSGQGSFFDTSGNLISNLAIAAGDSSASFEYTDLQAGTPTLTVGAIDLTSFAQQETVLPGPVNLLQSVVLVSTGGPMGASATVAVDGTAYAELVAKDAYGNQETTGGLSVLFGLGSGSSSGTFGIATYNGDGTYTATFTPTGVGTARAITATFNGQQVTSTPPTITVTAGPVGTISTDTPLFAWPAVYGATSYQLGLIDETDTVFDKTISNLLKGPSWQPAGQQALRTGDTYEWAYRATTSTGLTSWSSFLQFTIAGMPTPVPSSPTGTVAAASGYDRPTFYWTEPDSTYVGGLLAPVTPPNHRILYIEDTTVGKAVIYSATVTPTWLGNDKIQTSFSYSPNIALTPGHQYTWLVYVVSTNGQCILLSNPATFKLAPLAAPNPIGPTGTIPAGTRYDTPSFTWSSVPAANHYELQVFDVTRHRVALDIAVLGQSYTASAGLTPGHVYAWSMASYSTNGTRGPWSSSLNFTLLPLGRPIPSGPTGTIPAGTGYDTPIFTWSGVTGANHYEVQVVDVTAKRVAIDIAVIGSSFKAGAGLTPGHRFSWRVGAVSTNHQAINWSSIQYFSLAPLAVPTLIAPIGTASQDPPTFVWNSVPGADHYYLLVRDLTARRTLVISNPDVTATSFTPSRATALKPGHRFTWWVCAISTNGQDGPWSTGQTFTLVT
jgi:hypothetical protein